MARKISKTKRNKMKAQIRQQQERQKTFKMMEGLLLNPDFFSYMKAQYGDIVKNKIDMMKPEVMQEIYDYIIINERGEVLQRDSMRLFTEKDKSEELNVIECNIDDINMDKLKLVKENLDLYIPDISNMFTKFGLINLYNNGVKTEIIFSAGAPDGMSKMENEVDSIMIVVNQEGKLCGANFAHIKDDKPAINYGYSFSNYMKDMEKHSYNFKDYNYKAYTLNAMLNVASIVFYINSLATAPKSERQVLEAKQRRERSTSGRKKATQATKTEREVVIPRKFKVYKDNLLQFNNKTNKYERSVGRHSVSGHWRHYKSGKKVWINEFERGKGATKTTRKYVIKDK